MAAVKPVLQALLLADKVYRDVSGKFIICGVFNAFGFKRHKQAEEREAEAPNKRSMLDVQDVGNPWVYISLTDIKGTTPLELRYESMSGDKVLYSAEFQVTSVDPLQTVEIVLPVPRLPQIPGTFVLDLLYEGESLGSHRIRSVEVIDAGN